jgi:hypothetical protein
MHLTDEQLNEYLDRETHERMQMELHLSGCEACSARLTALRDLFSEIESLPEVELSPEFAARFRPAPSQPSALPRSLIWTLTLQAALVIATLFLAAPFVMQFVASYIPSVSVPSFLNLFMQLQNQWTAWLDLFSTLPVPALPRIPLVDLSSLFVIFTVVGVSLLWLIGKVQLLRNRMK